MNRISIALIIAVCFGLFSLKASAQGTIEVTGAATVSITPDRITVEIGFEEFYRKTSETDSVKVDINKLEKEALKALKKAGIPDSLIKITDVGNYFYPYRSKNFLMAMRLSAVITDMKQLYALSESLDFEGITSFRITETSNSDMEKYNRQGLKAAIEKAREKAEFIALSEGFSPRVLLLEVKEEGPIYYEEAAVTNVMLQNDSFDEDAGMACSKAFTMGTMSMDNMKKIVRRYSVRAKYSFSYQ